MPKTLLSTTRTRSPPTLVCTTWRSVWLLAVTGGGGRGGAAPAGGRRAEQRRPKGFAPAGRADGAAPAGGVAGGNGRATSAVAHVATHRSSALGCPSVGSATAKATTPDNNTRRRSRSTRATIDIGFPLINWLLG